MHFNSLRHVRDHAKVRGRAFELLQDIASHTNMHTGEAFELSVDRLAARHEITPQWVRRLLNLLLASGELVIQRSRGRHPNVYRIPYDRCHACQGGNPKLEYRDEELIGWQGFAEGNPEDVGGVYLLKSDDHYKIGHSRYPRRRVQLLTAENAHPVSAVHIIASSEREKLERAFHQLFRHRHERGEWFALTADDVAVFCRYQRMELCGSINPKLEARVHPLPDDVNPKVSPAEPESTEPPTRKWVSANPKVGGGLTARLAWIEPRKGWKDPKERKKGITRNFDKEGRDKPETQSPFWCPAHGYCHSERQPDHRPGCVLEPPDGPRGAGPEGPP